MIEKTCPICKSKYHINDNELWKKICYDCYKNYRYMKRIQPVGYKANVYISHPSVTKEEMNDWIRDNKLEIGWGAEEFDKTKVKIWINSINYD